MRSIVPVKQTNALSSALLYPLINIVTQCLTIVGLTALAQTLTTRTFNFDLSKLVAFKNQNTIRMLVGGPIN